MTGVERIQKRGGEEENKWRDRERENIYMNNGERGANFFKMTIDRNRRGRRSRKGSERQKKRRKDEG